MAIGSLSNTGIQMTDAVLGIGFGGKSKADMLAEYQSFIKEANKLGKKEQAKARKVLDKEFEQGKKDKLKQQLEENEEALRYEKDKNKAIGLLSNKFRLEEKIKNKEAWAEVGKSALAAFGMKANTGESFSQGMARSMGSMMKTAGKIAGKALGGLNDILESFNRHFTLFNTRLQGTSRDASSITAAINRGIGGSQAVAQVDVMNRVADMVNQGISFNVELRGTLAALTDKIATTFDPMDGTLLRLVKLQQADSTAARLGYESILNRFLNQNFQDSSYLNTDAASVRAALLEATATMDNQVGAEFEYTVQKWLGAFSSVGMGSGTIGGLASGLGMLGSGNVTGITGSIQNMLVSAAANAGLNYGQLLTQGLSAQNVNALLAGIYNQAVKVSGAGDRVAMQQMADLFGMSMADLRAISNLDPKTINSIADSTNSYAQAMGELDYQLTQVNARTSVKDRIDNIMKNVLGGVASGIATNAGLYTTWAIADFLEQSGGIETPSIAGFKLPNVENLMKAGVLGISLLTNMGTVLSNFNISKAIERSNFNEDNFVSRGTGSIFSQGTSGVSASWAIGSSDESDIFETNGMSAEDSQKIQGAEESSQKQSELITLLLDDGQDNIMTVLRDIRTGVRNIDDQIKNPIYGYGII